PDAMASAALLEPELHAAVAVDLLAETAIHRRKRRLPFLVLTSDPVNLFALHPERKRRLDGVIVEGDQVVVGMPVEGFARLALVIGRVILLDHDRRSCLLIGRRRNVAITGAAVTVVAIRVGVVQIGTVVARPISVRITPIIGPSPESA